MSASLATQVYDKLMARILNNETAAGEFINRRELAAELGVSTAPVTEAMIRMESEGLLETLPRKGTRVTVVKDEDIAGTLLIREALEGMAARLYCGEVIAAHRAKLSAMAAELDALPLRSYKYFAMDCALHCAMVALCNNGAFFEEYSRITCLGLFYNTNRLLSSNEASVRDSHVLLIDNLCRARPDVAQRLIHEHIAKGKRNLILSRDDG